MSHDTPLTQILRESVDPFVTSEAVERCLTAYASLERALDAATKERDSEVSMLRTHVAAQKDALTALRAQLSDLQSSTPQDHARVIEELLCYVFYRAYDRGHNDTVEAQLTDVHASDAYDYWAEDVRDLLNMPDVRDLADKLLKPQPLINADFLEEQIAFRLEEALADGKIDPESFVAANRKVLRELIDMAILTPQPRKEGDEPCRNSVTTAAITMSSEVAPASNAAHTSDPSGAATCTCFVLGHDGDAWECPRHKRVAISPFPELEATPAPPRETTNGKVDVSGAAREIVRITQRPTCKGAIESILTRLTGDQATRIAELEADKVRLDWLSANSLSYWRTESVALVITEYDGGGNLKDFCRSVIDAAMKKQP